MMLTPIEQGRLWAVVTLQVAVVCLTFGLLYGAHRGWTWMAMTIVAIGAVAAVLAVPAYRRMQRDNAAAGSDSVVTRSSTVRTCYWVVIVCSVVLLVVTLTDVESPLDLVVLACNVVVIGAGFLGLRKTPRQHSATRAAR